MDPNAIAIMDQMLGFQVKTELVFKDGAYTAHPRNCPEDPRSSTYAWILRQRYKGYVYTDDEGEFCNAVRKSDGVPSAWFWPSLKRQEDMERFFNEWTPGREFV